jgi:hypothetical protein
MVGMTGTFDAFLQEHRPRGELEGGVEAERVWMV